MVNLRTYGVVANLGVNLIGKVECRSAIRQCLRLTLGCEGYNIGLVER